jgi:hypothetical protein
MAACTGGCTEHDRGRLGFRIDEFATKEGCAWIASVAQPLVATAIPTSAKQSAPATR